MARMSRTAAHITPFTHNAALDRFEQSEVTDDELLASTTVHNVLGRGGFGIVGSCIVTLRGAAPRALVIKIPCRSLISANPVSYTHLTLPTKRIV